MANFATGFQGGMRFAREEDEARYAQRQRQLNDRRVNAARDAAVDRYGTMAGDPVTYGQLEGIEQRRTTFDRGIEDDDAARRMDAIRNAAGMYEQAVSRGASPEEAAASLRQVMPLIAPNEEVAGQALQALAADPSQAESIFRTLSGEGIAEPEYGEADFYDVGGREVYGRPVVQPDGSVGFEELPFEAQRAGTFTDPRFPGILLERDPSTGQTRAVAQNPAAMRGAAGGAAGQMVEAGEDLSPEERRARLELLSANRRDEFREVQDSVNNALDMVGRGSAGAAQTLTGWLGGTPATNLRLALEPLRSGVARDQITQMKQEAAESGSRGTGLGQITQRELDMLQNALGALDPNAGPEVLRESLANILALRERIQQRMTYIDAVDAGLMSYSEAVAALRAEDIDVPEAPGRTGRTGGQAGRRDTPPPPEVGAVIDGWRFNGGDPADPNSYTRVE